MPSPSPSPGPSSLEGLLEELRRRVGSDGEVLALLGRLECPVEAIFDKCDVPDKWQDYIELNAERSAALKAGDGHITEKQAPLLGPGCKGAE
jgi:hypothetical protein